MPEPVQRGGNIITRSIVLRRYVRIPIMNSTIIVRRLSGRTFSSTRRAIMSISTYPYAASPADPSKVIPLLPLLPPPRNHKTPIASLPVRPDRQPLQGYTLTRHTFPGAFPRTAPGFVSFENRFTETDDPLGNVYSASKDERQALIEEAVKTVRKVYVDAGARTAADLEKETFDDEPVVRLAVNRFTRNDLVNRSRSATNSDNEPGLTLIVCHANGFHKEMWEETLRGLIAHVQAAPEKGIRIDEIWALDHVNQGESFRLNGGRIGPVASWADCVSVVVCLTWMLG
jgi:hypothetical protein